MTLGDAVACMHATHKSRIRQKTGSGWRRYLTDRRALHDVDPRGEVATVRFKPAGFAART